jgi:probable F420-dependent oxidoreductase
MSRCECCGRRWSTIRPRTPAAIAPRPVPPLDIWLGGSAPAAFRRIGSLGDGWLGSFLTPAEARAGREAIERAAERAGRQIEPDHFGISLAVAEGADGEMPAELAAAARRRRPELDPAELIAVGWDRLHRQLDAYIDAGLTKFVIRPAGGARLDGFIDRFVAELVGRQN